MIFIMQFFFLQEHQSKKIHRFMCVAFTNYSAQAIENMEYSIGGSVKRDSEITFLILLSYFFSLVPKEQPLCSFFLNK